MSTYLIFNWGVEIIAAVIYGGAIAALLTDEYLQWRMEKEGYGKPLPPGWNHNEEKE